MNNNVLYETVNIATMLPFLAVTYVVKPIPLKIMLVIFFISSIIQHASKLDAAYILDCATQVAVIMTITWLINNKNTSNNTNKNIQVVALVIQTIVLCNLARYLFTNKSKTVDSSRNTDFKLETNAFFAYAALFIFAFPKLSRITIMLNMTCLVLFAVSAYNCVEFCAISWPLIHLTGAGTVYFMLKDLHMI